MNNLVVARYLDGTILKGTSLDVDPTKPAFHVRPPDGITAEVKMKDLKALFFVRSLEGDMARHEAHTIDPADPRARGSTAVSLQFPDGEVMIGLTNRFPPNRPFFFVVPVDPESNNIRVLVNRSAVKKIEPLGGGPM
ncbi:MAG: hypothetical protein E4H41_09900 [Gemmatimonadales bacterium]|jgi:hypothetical protein|nr:MAG: hypothetical protein E4H41_09900 [Gemmatimonadales bacterium]